jgi:hypothetical protein
MEALKEQVTKLQADLVGTESQIVKASKMQNERPKQLNFLKQKMDALTAEVRKHNAESALHEVSHEHKKGNRKSYKDAVGLSKQLLHMTATSKKKEDIEPQASVVIRTLHESNSLKVDEGWIKTIGLITGESHNFLYAERIGEYKEDEGRPVRLYLANESAARKLVKMKHEIAEVTKEEDDSGLWVEEYLTKEEQAHKKAWWKVYIAAKKRKAFVQWRKGNLWVRVSKVWKNVSKGDPPKDGTLDIDMDCTEEEEGDESESAGSAVETFSTPMA